MRFLLKSKNENKLYEVTDKTVTPIDFTEPITPDDFVNSGVEDLSLIIGSHEGEHQMNSIGEVDGLKLLSYKIFGFEDIESISVKESKTT